jgi:phosphatidylserine decarboxylase precursor-related protein
MDYELTFKKRNPILFFIILVSFAVISLTFHTFYFSAFIVLLWIFIEYFYRLPKFVSREDLRKLDNRLGLYVDKSMINSYILSPCYGTVKKIILNKDFIRIISVLSVFDIHYQFAPMDSVIIQSEYKKGEFNIAYLLEKSNYNERNHVIFSDANAYKVEVIQIAGVLARRIEILKDKKTYKQGEPYGLIHFGSRVDIILPTIYKGKPISLLVAEGDKLRGPNTKLCILN